MTRPDFGWLPAADWTRPGRCGRRPALPPRRIRAACVRPWPGVGAAGAGPHRGRLHGLAPVHDQRALSLLRPGGDLILRTHGRACVESVLVTRPVQIVGDAGPDCSAPTSERLPARAGRARRPAGTALHQRGAGRPRRLAARPGDQCAERRAARPASRRATRRGDERHRHPLRRPGLGDQCRAAGHAAEEPRA